jgi:transcription antitermination factor NusG
MNQEALSKKMREMNIREASDKKTEIDSINLELMNLKDNKKNGEMKILPKKELIKFNHGIYGTITSGGYKGYEAEIKEFFPEKIIIRLKDGSKIYSSRKMLNISREMNATIKKGKLKGKSGKILEIVPSKVRVLINSKPEIVYTEDVFYHDILLENDIIAQVIKIEKDGNLYKYYIKTLKKGKQTIPQKDIKLYLMGFRVKTGKDEEIDSDELLYSDQLLYEQDKEQEKEQDEDMESETDVIDYGDNEIEEDEGDMEGDEYKLAYSDIERISKMTPKLTGKVKESYNIVKKILELNNENELSINIYNVLDNMDNILKHIYNKLVEKDINFDIYKSVIDRRLILCVLTAYEMISSEDVRFVGLSKYLTGLYDGDFFKMSKLKDSVLINTDLFKCEIKSDEMNIDNIYLMVGCFDNMIKKILNKDIDLEKIEEQISDIDLQLIVPKMKDYKKFRTIDELLENNIPISYKDLISNKQDGKILVGLKFDRCLNVYKFNLREYIDNEELSKLQKYLYEFIHDNFTNIEELNKLENDVIKIISGKFDDFKTMYDNCDNNKDYFNVDMCKENVIISYISNYTSDIKGKGNMDDLKTLLKYKEFIRLSKEFMVFLKECYSESKIYQSEKISEIRGKLESIKRKRDLEYLYDEKTKEWVKKKKD